MSDPKEARLAAVLDVSRETFDRLNAYEALLKKWNPAINLVSAQTLAQVWERHFLDSAQVFALAAPHAGHWVDLGSGGGFPGLVIAAIAAELAPDLTVTLVESDRRKSAFLATVSRDLGLNTQIIAKRIEEVDPLDADFLSARALASLDALLGFAERHLRPSGTAFFPKGAKWRDELAEARKSWSISLKTHPSMTDPEAAILEITGVQRV
ncbi:16S rRNA (guanine(527)-N(7))-methyltransferase RsmG [Sinirhodobacter sp. WL0062]|uniref:Ribosomal RNA small subunit methyltransferase G n=1 Tax=Rhodobacter flavimaris TaxID=2907145 RepID=A0ABS8YWI7_9RHOB|nr:16S rRNA (guanine(527)-N(7))-methyltransferase RsmG [Sinirhodobacter sp. WL0062]MCE5974184.1 16S rRNA (guanine(527)-N(7))-methyltransferase RsmG [Sinirhodobacter sp. WL0062]